MDWLKAHVFIAAWASPIIALIGMLIKKSPDGTPLNWSKMMIYVGFLTGLAVVVTPGVDPIARSYMSGLVSIGFGYLIVDSAWRR